MSWKCVLVVAVAIGGWSMLAQPRATSPALEERVARLQSRIESVESVRAIKRLQYAYGHYTELGLWNDFADLFADDARTNYQQGAQGRAEVRKLFFDQVGQGKLGLADGRIYPHILFQPVITLAPDGRTAKGRWRILAMLGGFGGSATWYSGVYENEYRQDNGVWKISVLHSEPRATAAYTAAGWRDSGAHVPLHYEVANLGKPSASSASAKPSQGVLADRVNELARRAERLNDQAAVTNVLDTYGYAFDRKQWDQVTGLFANDGTMELGQQGVYVGKASIRRGLNRFASQTLNDHVYLQTLVTVAPDGRTAMARGVEVIFSTGELSEGVFENTFVKENHSWKIQSVHFYPRMIVDAAQGWAKSAKPAPGPSREFPPDRPPTSSYEIYPKFSVAPFHFDNPVTGKPPQYPEGVRAAARPTTTAVPAGSAIRNASDWEKRIAELERSVAEAEAYDVAENLLGAYGYGRDDTRSSEGRTLFASHIQQPVIDIARDGKGAKVRARLLDLEGTSGGAGFWSAGTFEAQMVSEKGTWKFTTARSSAIWSAPYPDGWAK